MTNKEIAKLLRNVAAVYIIHKESRFRISAYENAADTIEQLAEPLVLVFERNHDLAGLAGIGATIGGYLQELLESGKSSHFETILSRVPSSVFTLMDIEGIGPKRAYTLSIELGLADATDPIARLYDASIHHIIAGIEGFGEKSEQDIKEAIERYMRMKEAPDRMPLPTAYAIAEAIKTHMLSHPDVTQVEALGSLRRGVSTIGDIDIAVIATKSAYASVIEHFIHAPGVELVDNAGGEKASIYVVPHIRIDMRLVEKETYGSMLQYFTGSKTHNILLREFALTQGYSLSEYGIKEVKTGTMHRFAHEEGFYRFLGLQYIPPEIREGTIEIPHAREHIVPSLIDISNIRGDLHVHSSFDIHTSHDIGAHTYEELLQTAKQKGYEYIGFTDHNPAQSGHTEASVITLMESRMDAIRSASKTSRVVPFIGLEVDILPDGSLAFPKGALHTVDYLIASIHSSFTMSKEQMTTRLLTALSHPKVKVFGHPTGRIINKRDGITADWKAVFSLAKERGIAIELNSTPERLDLPDSMIGLARDMGCMFMINTDAHSCEGMNGMHFGVTLARRGWLTADQVVNTKHQKDFERWLLESRKSVVVC